MGLGCAACGDCCDPVHLSPENVEKVDRARAELADGREYPPDTSPTESLPFILEHWTELDRDEWGAFYACDRFDSAARSCTAHDDRPDVCREFPWYGDVVRSGGRFEAGSRCSYLLEVAPADRPVDARPLIPMRVAGR